MTFIQQIATIAICVAGTMSTRFLPFFVFREGEEIPSYIQYLGKALPSAIFAMLVVYCLRNVSFISGTYGIPELFSLLVTTILHLWKRQMLISIAGGTVCYMLFVQLVF